MLLPTATSCSNCQDNCKRRNYKNIIALQSYSTIQKYVDSPLRVSTSAQIKNRKQAIKNWTMIDRKKSTTRVILISWKGL